MNNEKKEENNVVEQNNAAPQKSNNNSPLTDKNNGGSNKVGIIIALVILLLSAVGFICYDKFINKEESPVPTPTIVPASTEKPVTVDNGITILNKVEITDIDKVVSIEDKEFKIKKEISVDGAFLIINDSPQEIKDNETVYADFAYATDKYIMFTLIAQDGEKISYAIDKDGKQITVEDGDYQMQEIKLVDGNLQTSGHIFCGLDGDCPDKPLLIKYENNTIKVTPIE